MRGAPALSCIAPSVRGTIGGRWRSRGDADPGRCPGLSCIAPTVRGTIGAMAGRGCRPYRATHLRCGGRLARWWLIPHIPFVELDLVALEEISEFVLE